MDIPKVGHIDIGYLVIHGNGRHDDGQSGILGAADLDDALERNPALYDKTVQNLILRKDCKKNA